MFTEADLAIMNQLHKDRLRQAEKARLIRQVTMAYAKSGNFAKFKTLFKKIGQANRVTVSPVRPGLKELISKENKPC